MSLGNLSLSLLDFLTIYYVVTFWFQVVGVGSSMVVEISTRKGSVRHRKRLAATAPICLQPIPHQSWKLSTLFCAFLAGTVFAFFSGLWWLLHLED